MSENLRAADLSARWMSSDKLDEYFTFVHSLIASAQLQLQLQLERSASRALAQPTGSELIKHANQQLSWAKDGARRPQQQPR